MAPGAPALPAAKAAPPDERAVAYGPDAAQVLDVYRPPPTGAALARGTLVYVHGGSFVGGWREAVTLTNPELLGVLRLGWGVVSIDYRLLPAAGGITAEVGDVRRAIEWARAHGPAHGLDPSTIVVVGHSAGGTLAELSAAAPAGPGRPDAWVAVSGVADIGAWATANHATVPTPEPLAAVSPLTASAVPSVPGYVIHAEADPFLPVAQARALVDRYRGAGDTVTFDEVTVTPTCHPHSATCGMDMRAFAQWLSRVGTTAPAVPPGLGHGIVAMVAGQ